LSTSGHIQNGRRKAYVVTETTGVEPVETFFETVTITSASAATPVNILPDARVGAGRKVYLEYFIARVNGTTVWGTTSTVKVQDTSSVDLVTLAVAGLTSQARLVPASANVTLEDAYSLGTGCTAGKGIQVKGDVNGTGSPLVITVKGVIR
jgi:hypothetical protein